jgi:hypothetical protein
MLTYDRFSVVYSSDIGAGALPLNLESISTFFSLAPTFFFEYRREPECVFHPVGVLKWGWGLLKISRLFFGEPSGSRAR